MDFLLSLSAIVDRHRAAKTVVYSISFVSTLEKYSELRAQWLSRDEWLACQSHPTLSENVNVGEAKQFSELRFPGNF